MSFLCGCLNPGIEQSAPTAVLLHQHTGNNAHEAQASGGTYTGEWQGNVRHGRGVQVWPDGARYEGQWEEDKAHGHG
eukprot:3694804-Amphidinium_carterae.1